MLRHVCAFERVVDCASWPVAYSVVSFQFILTTCPSACLVRLGDEKLPPCWASVNKKSKV